MKKYILAALLAAIMLTGCGSSNEEAAQEVMESMENENVESIYSTVSALSTESLVKINDSLIENYYGINPEDFSEYVFAQCESPMSAETIIIAKAKDGVDISGYEENIDNIIEQRKGEMTNYNLPDQVVLLENAEKGFSDAGFYLVISEKAETIAETIEKGLGL